MKLRTLHIVLVIVGLFALQFEYKYEWQIHDWLPEHSPQLSEVKICEEETGGEPVKLEGETDYAHFLRYLKEAEDCAKDRPGAVWSWTLITYWSDDEYATLQCHRAVGFTTNDRYRFIQCGRPAPEARHWPQEPVRWAPE